eukprot:3833851-Prymnesium_polylepis.1
MAVAVAIGGLGHRPVEETLLRVCQPLVHATLPLRVARRRVGAHPLQPRLYFAQPRDVFGGCLCEPPAQQVGLIEEHPVVQTGRSHAREEARDAMALAQAAGIAALVVEIDVDGEHGGRDDEHHDDGQNVEGTPLRLGFKGDEDADEQRGCLEGRRDLVVDVVAPLDVRLSVHVDDHYRRHAAEHHDRPADRMSHEDRHEHQWYLAHENLDTVPPVVLCLEFVVDEAEVGKGGRVERPTRRDQHTEDIDVHEREQHAIRTGIQTPVNRPNVLK